MRTGAHKRARAAEVGKAGDVEWAKAVCKWSGSEPNTAAKGC